MRFVNSMLSALFTVVHAKGSHSMVNRRVEYLSASIMVGWAVLIVLSTSNSITSTLAFLPMVKRGWTEVQLAVILGCFGLAWLIALFINGNYRRTPIIRCFCACGGAVMWSHVATMLAISGFETGIWSTGLPTYATLAVFDLASCYRSAIDAYFAHVQGRIKDRLDAARNER